MENQPTISQPQVADEVVRGRSTVEFPYFDLDGAVEIAQAIRELGVSSCEQTSLAAKLSMAPDGGGFRMRIITAKIFNLISYGRSSNGMIELTDIGKMIAEPQTEKRGRVDSFMSVSLYKTLFERLKGQTMPPPLAIEGLMQTLGVAPKQKDRARQVFLRSAKQASLFEIAPDRLTYPAMLNVGNTTSQVVADTHEKHKSSDEDNKKNHKNLHPFIQGLIQKLPEPDSEWDLVARAKWLTTAANIFDLMYSPGSDMGLKVTLEGSTLSVSVGGLV